MTENLVKEMIKAVDANIYYLREKGSSQITLKNGELLTSIGDIHLYRFPLHFFQNIEVDTEIEIRIKDVSSNGRITAVDDDFVQLELEKNIGEEVPDARLIISNYYLMQKLSEKLKAIDSGTLKQTDLAEKTFREKLTTISTNFLLPEVAKYSLNQSQFDSVKKVIENEVTYIWGPPGTGKTKTIASIIESLLANNLSVLLISHTNVATDGALLSLVKQMIDSPYYVDGKIIRVGDIQDEELKEDKYENIKIKNVAMKLSVGIQENLAVLKRTADELERNNANLEMKVREYEKLSKKKNDLEYASSELEIISNLISVQKAEVDKWMNVLKNSQQQIDDYKKMGAIRRFFSGINVQNIESAKIFHLRKIEGIDFQIEKLGHEEKRIKENHTKIKGCVEEYEEKLKDFDKEKAFREFEKYKIILADTKNRIALLNKELEELEDKVIKDAVVIATTLTRSYSSEVILKREYDCVIIDEASMAPLPALWCAAGLAKKKVVIVGDFYQLPPIIKHKVQAENRDEKEIKEEEALIDKWLRKDIFEQVNIVSSIEKGDKPEWLEQLKVQYRMHPEIAQAVNHLAYAKNSNKFALDSHSSTYDYGEKLLNQMPLKGAHLGICDTLENNTYPSKTDNGSYYNLYHALLAIELSKQAINSGYDKIGIISPFRAQTNLLRKMVKDQKLEEKVVADTVHRFQGHEKQIIIFDTTTADSTKLTDDKSEGKGDEKLINVALSRAIEKCILIVDVNAVDKKHSLHSPVRKLLKYCSDKNMAYFSSDGLLYKYHVNEDSEKWLEKIFDINKLTREINQSSLHDQSDFYQNFIRDLLSAEKEVIIDSPYVTSERVNNLFPVLELLMNKNVKIFIVTRKPKEHSEAMKHQAEKELKRLESKGIIVLPFTGFYHRKLAIIDRKILWEGSLNILSQKDSHEIMRRFYGEETANQTMNFLKWDRNIGPIGENKIKKCDVCEGPGAWFWTEMGFYGIWQHCLVGGHKIGKPPVSQEEKDKKKKKIKTLRKSVKETSEDGSPICPEHQIPMIKRMGRWGEFWGCKKYPVCKVTHKMAK
jgi:superfamily I DNA and/or RNA helicase